MRITVLAGGIGGARFTRGLLHHLATTHPDGTGASTAEVTVIGNTGDDIRLFGLRICPDLDTVMYTLGGGISAERGWGREDESFTIKEELSAYGMQPDWFGLGDRDTATHLVRTQMLDAGWRLSAVTEALCARWKPGVRLLPMTDDRVETHVIVDGDKPGARKAIHFQEWWIRHRASIPAYGFTLIGAEDSKPGPGVVEAIRDADVVLLPPSNPVVSIGTILQVPGIRDAVIAATGPVVGISPIIGGAPVRGMADACLTALGIETSAAAVARHYGPRHVLMRDAQAALNAGNGTQGILDGWLVHDESDAAYVDELNSEGIATRAVPLLMTDVDLTAAMASAALELAESVRPA